MSKATTFITLSLFISACQIESCASQDVGSGIARLTIRNAGALTKLIDRDPSCGFGSDAVLSNPKLEGAPGAIGSVTWTITNCTLAFTEPTTALKTCGDVETKVTGKATLSGTKTIKGTMTGNPKSPVIPVEPDAVRFALQASFEDFVARRPDSQSSLTNSSGALAWTAEPRLAVSASKGVCSIATSNVTFSDVSYSEATALVESKGRRFSTDVTASAYSAQVGKRGDKENWIAGELTVYGNPVRFAGAALDPDYESATFLKSWECVEDLKQPLDFACPSLDDKVSQGAARMTASLFGRLADFFDEETTCGFGSAAVQASPVLSGSLGEGGGSATWSLGSGCTSNFSMPTVVKTDCFGAQTLLTGTVTARGTKTVRGIRTGDPAQPIVPTSRDPGRADVSFEFSNLRISDSISSTAMTVQSGSLSGTIATRTGLNSDSAGERWQPVPTHRLDLEPGGAERHQPRQDELPRGHHGDRWNERDDPRRRAGSRLRARALRGELRMQAEAPARHFRRRVCVHQAAGGRRSAAHHSVRGDDRLNGEQGHGVRVRRDAGEAAASAGGGERRADGVDVVGNFQLPGGSAGARAVRSGLRWSAADDQRHRERQRHADGGGAAREGAAGGRLHRSQDAAGGVRALELGRSARAGGLLAAGRGDCSAGAADDSLGNAERGDQAGARRAAQCAGNV